MIILFIGGLILGGLVVIFILQNTEIVTVSLFSWQFSGSLSLVMFLTISVVLAIVALLALPGSFKNYLQYRKLQKINLKLEDELKKQKELTIFAKNTPPLTSTTL
ncbi:MAG: LapA family protein [Candidatus Paceibacterota bacterium]